MGNGTDIFGEAESFWVDAGSGGDVDVGVLLQAVFPAFVFFCNFERKEGETIQIFLGGNFKRSVRAWKRCRRIH